MITVPDGDHVAGLAVQLDHLAGDVRGNLDIRLVGHHVGQDLLLGHDVAGLHVPVDQLDLGDALRRCRAS
jgi:hypothetical protein